MNQDEQHLDLLSVFHYVVGGLTALFSCVFLMHVAMGVAMLCGAFDGDDAPPRFMAWMFILLPSIVVLAGWTLAGFIVATGRKLKKRTSYTFCLVVAGIECIVMPFGTVLGVFTLVVLSRESVKALFSRHQTGVLNSDTLS
ncbi:hypothetical protein Pcar_2289 [Syntrophotalea carbinolica DSM 2380]|uniref:Uncharacterized protein n=1 Tax=Syntrophotalea carbinolica (strain DSM 2380 / NBRC 103641 / GraBd1) TaxID=338963 RepID=Q3A279_SYNC1|nr:hypothetical protein Pcar_2289 [Syntrophotalea carbinolica DSM 2380]